ncbi:MAG TPA: polysaccharide deacetylase family protein [Bradyrhizobium sp.]|jgi:peptidoglycan-N-acetylglucosamine deacetylase|nr:polysaccharide deacetylase family protein [Bradyrhizobium sp.]
MIGNVLAGVRTPPWTVLCLGWLACAAAPAAFAAECPGHPDAIGTSRILVVDPREHPRIGTMQYPETLPLADHEVVLTFDDGPLPRYSNQILEILAAQCVKATFFTIGRMASASPEGVRKLAAAGHSIGTHTQNHPLTMNHMPIERAKQEIDDGIASVKAALGDDTALAPFFRIPGLLRADGVEDYLASLGIQIWSADFLADDWRHVSSSRVYDLAIKRLEEKGKGILLLHDIHARTVAALPRILQELKARGFRVVHVVPATPQNPATPTEPQQWQLHPPTENVAISRWPKIPNFVFAGTGALPAPVASEFDGLNDELLLSAEPFDHVKHLRRGTPLPREALWPRQTEPAPKKAGIALPVPAQSVFEIPEGLGTAMLAAEATSRRAELSAPDHHEAIAADAGHSRHAIRGKPASARRVARRATRPAAHAGHGKLKHLVQVRKRSA